MPTSCPQVSQADGYCSEWHGNIAQFDLRPPSQSVMWTDAFLQLIFIL